MVSGPVVRIERVATREQFAASWALCTEVFVGVSAQDSAVDFYARLGYRLTDAEPYLDAGIWHRSMVKELGPATSG